MSTFLLSVTCANLVFCSFYENYSCPTPTPQTATTLGQPLCDRPCRRKTTSLTALPVTTQVFFHLTKRCGGRPKKTQKMRNPLGANQHAPPAPSLGFTLRDSKPRAGTRFQPWEFEFLQRGRDCNGWVPSQVAGVLLRDTATVEKHWWSEILAPDDIASPDECEEQAMYRNVFESLNGCVSVAKVRGVVRQKYGLYRSMATTRRRLMALNYV